VSISSQTEFFALVRSVVTTPPARSIIPKVSWVSVLKASFVCASCDAALAFVKRRNVLSAIIEMRISVNNALASNFVSS